MGKLLAILVFVSYFAFSVGDICLLAICVLPLPDGHGNYPWQNKTILEHALPHGLNPDSPAVRNWRENKMPPVCQNEEHNERTVLLRKTEDAITRLLNFFVTQFDEVNDGNMVLALGMLKAYDDQNSGVFEKRFGISDLIRDFCAKDTLLEEAVRLYCPYLIKDWRPVRRANITIDVIEDAANTLNYRKIGEESEVITPSFNLKCQSDLIQNCQSGPQCTQAYFAEEPSTQYMLSHQLLQRMLSNLMDCQSLQQYEDNSVENSLCAKMSMEAKLISHLGFPESRRDIFLEHVAFCGFRGYANLFRSDWLQEILKWQSKSEFGCFLGRKTPCSVLRRQINIEKEMDKNSEEHCDTHFTAVGLMALGGFWDHIRNCK